ncbi:MAG: hypothetical protein D6768_07440, partial [Chloroflexi bacterium]
MVVNPAENASPIESLSGHTILCGAGRTGRNIIERFCHLQVPFVVIEQDTGAIARAQNNVRKKFNLEFAVVTGDATEDDTLRRAGIERAAGLVAALSDDKDNLFATLTARSLNPKLRIVTRVNDEKNNRSKMEKAGADRVVSTEIIGGMRIASEMIRPEVVKFLDRMGNAAGKTIRFTELPLANIRTPELAARREALTQSPHGPEKLLIQDIGRHTGLLVVAVKSSRVDPETAQERDLFHLRKQYRFAPRGDFELHPDDILVVIGTQDTLNQITGATDDAAGANT